MMAWDNWRQRAGMLSMETQATNVTLILKPQNILTENE